MIGTLGSNSLLIHASSQLLTMNEFDRPGQFPVVAPIRRGLDDANELPFRQARRLVVGVCVLFYRNAPSTCEHHAPPVRLNCRSNSDILYRERGRRPRTTRVLPRVRMPACRGHGQSTDQSLYPTPVGTELAGRRVLGTVLHARRSVDPAEQGDVDDCRVR